MADDDTSENEFSFTIDFAKGVGDPRRVFDSASSLVDGFELLDEAMTGVVGNKIKTSIVLEDVQPGSLKVKLKNVLTAIPDEAIKDLQWKKAVGHYLLKGKYLVLKFLDDEKAATPAGLEDLRDNLHELGSDTDIRHLRDYAPIHEGRLVASLDQIQNAKRMLGPNDRLTVQTEDKTYEVDLTKTQDYSDIAEVQEVKETESRGEIILTIRKPDLLGQAMWQFSHGKNNISAAIQDEKWLTDFHDRKIPLYSGDALRCLAKFTYVYDEGGALIEQKIEILSILEVIKGAGPQLGFTM